jgi:hypothetical protein
MFEIEEVSILSSLPQAAVKDYKETFRLGGPAELRAHLIYTCGFDKIMAKLIIQEIRDGHRNE